MNINKLRRQPSISPAQLLIGPHTLLIEEAKKILKEQFCQHNSCNTCIVCKQIDEKQHHGAIWLEPEKQYTLEQLEPIFKQITFALEPDQHLFFIIQKAAFLTPVCSNSLLKSVEEPPPGYHFLFLTERIQQILPTIRSRCVSQLFYAEAEKKEQTFLDLFKGKPKNNPSLFLKMITQENPNERDTIEYLDDLLLYWTAEGKKQLIDDKKEKYAVASQMIELIKKSFKKLPMPGSSKIFWRDFYLQVQQTISTVISS